MNLVPVVVAQTGRGKRTCGSASRVLRDRLVSLGSVIPGDIANLVAAQLLFLESESLETDSFSSLHLPAGLAVDDTGQAVRPGSATLCFDQTASVEVRGTKRKRYILLYAQTVVQQALGEVQRWAVHIDIQAREMPCLSEQLACLFMQHAGQSRKSDVERSLFWTGQRALEYGMRDEVIVSRSTKKS